MAIPIRQAEVVRRRIERFFFLVALLYMALIGRLVYLQVIRGDYFRARVADIRQEKMKLAAQRGDILDCDQRPLAVSTRTGDLCCDPKEIVDPQATAAEASAVFGIPAAELFPFFTPRQFANGRIDRHVVIRKNISAERIMAYYSALESTDRAVILRGVFVDEKPDRTFASGREAVHVVGTVQRMEGGKLRGVMGIEQSFDAVLAGEDGSMTAELDAHRRIIPDTQVARVEPRDGLSVRLTVDSAIQHIAEAELEKACAANKPLSGMALVMDPKTGGILAMASWPSFDPHTKKELKAGNLAPIANHTLSLYEPGSTMKILTVAAALDAGVIDANTVFHCAGSLQIGRRSVRCVAHGGHRGHGSVTPGEIIEHSCNVGTAQIGMRLGMERMAKWMERFNLLARTGVGLVGDNYGRLGLGEEGKRAGQAKVARVAFGQSIMVTPVAMTAAYASIANGGVLMKPRLVAAFEDGNGRPVQTFDPEPLRQVVSRQTARICTTALETVVDSGTGKGTANVSGYRVVGKTGTAQKVDPETRRYSGRNYVASFVGFLPASNPRAVIYVLLDSPSAGRTYGAQVAAPAFQSIAQQLMWYWKVPPDDPSTLDRSRSTRR